MVILFSCFCFFIWRNGKKEDIRVRTVRTSATSSFNYARPKTDGAVNTFVFVQAHTIFCL